LQLCVENGRNGVIDTLPPRFSDVNGAELRIEPRAGEESGGRRCGRRALGER
jgi:hypothetical protein